MTANWSGSASEAALERTTFLSSRSKVGAEVGAAAAPVLRDYAAALRGRPGAVRPRTGRCRGGAGCAGAGSTPAEGARRDAERDLRAADHEMSAAVRRAEEANAAAANSCRRSPTSSLT